jgi:hypothetical protein
MFGSSQGKGLVALVSYNLNNPIIPHSIIKAYNPTTK